MNWKGINLISYYTSSAMTKALDNGCSAWTVLTDTVYMDVTTPYTYIKTGFVMFYVMMIVFGYKGSILISLPSANRVSVLLAMILVNPDI